MKNVCNFELIKINKIQKKQNKKKQKKQKKVNSQRISAVSSGVVILSQGSQETIKLTQLRLLSI